MAQSAAHLVDYLIPRVPVRPWVQLFPIALRIQYAAHPKLLTLVLQVNLLIIVLPFLLKQARLKANEQGEFVHRVKCLKG